MKLDGYQVPSDFHRGAPRWKEALWLVADALFVGSWLPGSAWRIWLLRIFGAKIGNDTTFKPRVRIKFPWSLDIGNHCWIGESVWLDNLGSITVGDHVCVSQGAYIGTGSHDWTSDAFDLIVTPVTISNHVWVCARTTIAPGAVLEEGAVIGLGTVFSGRAEAWTIYSGQSNIQSRPRLNPLSQ